MPTQKSQSLEDLFVDMLKDTYSAENQILKALPKMIKKTTSDELRKCFETHLQQTETQIDRLEKFAQTHDISLRGKKCVGMEGLIDEGKEVMDEYDEDFILDAGMIAAAQKIEHYEISAYGTLISMAGKLGKDEGVDLLKETLDEEKETDTLLTKVAEETINVQAES